MDEPIILVFAVVFIICVIVIVVLLTNEAARRSEERRVFRKEYDEFLVKNKKALDHFSKLYEERKEQIGIVECPQCMWRGEWGTGMSFKQIFAGDLNKKKAICDDDPDISMYDDNRQFECPICTSPNWKKV